MSREITTHKVNGCNEAIEITAMDEPGSGGANHHYRLAVIPPECWEKQNDGSVVLDIEKTAKQRTGCDLKFQNGPVSAGINGITNEALLAVVIDRLRSFQNGAPGDDLHLTAKGPFACRENALALTKLEEAMHWLHHRTRGRVARGVEGTLQK